MEAYPSTPTPMFDRVLAIASLRHAGMECRHPGPAGCVGNIRINLGSGSPCRNDDPVL